jgi:hypothetical protein
MARSNAKFFIFGAFRASSLASFDLAQAPTHSGASVCALFQQFVGKFSGCLGTLAQRFRLHIGLLIIGVGVSWRRPIACFFLVKAAV